MAQAKTIKISGDKDYAKVADRLKIFWEQNPNGKIETERENLSDAKIRFIARIWRDSSELIELAKAGTSVEVIKMTANATASADATKKGDKENEKLETVAVGRALAMLGYLASGEVASREEMEEFEDYKAQKHQESVEQAIELLNGAATIDDLRKVFVSLERKIREEPNVIIAKNKCKEKLTKKVSVKKEQNDENNQNPAK